MKAILEFDLSDHEDKIHHLRCVQSQQLVSFIHDFGEYLRAEYKYNGELTSIELAMIEKVREKFYSTLGDYNIDLDELT